MESHGYHQSRKERDRPPAVEKCRGRGLAIRSLGVDAESPTTHVEAAWNFFGRGFDSRRLHSHLSITRTQREEVAMDICNVG
jgi:hypothetical protein